MVTIGEALSTAEELLSGDHPERRLNGARSRPLPLAAYASQYGDLRPDRWAPVPAELDAAIGADALLAAAARAAREPLVAALAQRLGEVEPRHLAVVLDVPRERFVLPEDIAASADDKPMPLDREGLATVSAPHAYLLTYRLLGLADGDELIELGTGSGYGAALARAIVGARGRVTTVEIDADLYRRAARLLGADASGAAPAGDTMARVTLIRGDARALAPGLLAERAAVGAKVKVAVTYALATIPEDLESALPEGGCLVAPIGASEEEQDLVRCERHGGTIRRSRHGAVRYVVERKR